MRVTPNPANVFMDDLDNFDLDTGAGETLGSMDDLNNFDLDDDDDFELVLPFPAQAMQPNPALPNDVRPRALRRFRSVGITVKKLTRLRRTWSEIGAWLNANRDKRGSRQHRRFSFVFTVIGRTLQRMRTSALFNHLRRVSGVMKYR